jgi:hypothetical protein
MFAETPLDNLNGRQNSRVVALALQGVFRELAEMSLRKKTT